MSDPLPVFAGLVSFGRAPRREISELEEGQIGLAGCAFDHTCEELSGARFGPRIVREASTYFGYHSQAGGPAQLEEVSTGDVLTLSEPRLFDLGDLNIYPTDLDKTERSFVDGVAAIVGRGAIPALLGGDEYVLRPVAEGFAAGHRERGSEAVGLVHLSGRPAAADRHGLFDGRWGGATIRRLVEGGFDPGRVALLGASGSCRREELDFVESQGIHFRRASEIADPDVAAEEALARVAPGGEPFLLGVDAGILDGAFGPATSSPSFTGLTNTELLMLLDAFAKRDLAGFALTGVNPRVEDGWTLPRLATVMTLRALARRLGGE
jgi:arginase family enzyme